VLSYLRQRGRPGLVADETGDDITDALTLRLWLWWEGEAAELWLLEAAESLGRDRRPLCERLGLRSTQGLVDRIRYGHKKFGRAPATVEPTPAPVEAARIRAIAAALVSRRGEMPEEIADGFELDTLADALTRWPPGAPPPSAGTVNALRFVLGDLAVAVPAGSALRPVVDEGVALVGTRSAGPSAI
jgi:hypothetical protein